MSTIEPTSNMLDTATHATTQALGQVSGAAQRGLHAMQDGTHRLMEQAHMATDRTATYIKDEPMKSMLMAAAAGAISRACAPA